MLVFGLLVCMVHLFFVFKLLPIGFFEPKVYHRESIQVGQFFKIPPAKLCLFIAMFNLFHLM
jgi:hypothetical protein